MIYPGEMANFDDNIEQVIARMGGDVIGRWPAIFCFFTGHRFSRQQPRCCVTRYRRPRIFVGPDFFEFIKKGIELNPAVHDGAVMISRQSPDDCYSLVGWSYRLFPDVKAVVNVANRGSAFNSCLALSVEDAVDRLYLLSERKLFRFEKGTPSNL